MRVSYFGYYLADPTNGNKWLVDLSQFVADFVKYRNLSFKSGIKYNDEELYLLPLNRSVYLFLQARDHEIIKAIERQHLSVADIRSKLRKNESVGFASYVFMAPYFLGIACRVLSPRISAFSGLINEVFNRLSLPYILVPRALTENTPLGAVSSFEHVGAVRIEINANNNIFTDLVDLVTGGASDTVSDIASIELTIKPVRKGKRSLRDLLEATAESLPDNGLERLEARARKEAHDQVRDVYLIGEGGVRDFLSTDAEQHIPGQIRRLAAENAVLRRKVSEFSQEFSTGQSHVKKDAKRVGDLSQLGLTGKFSGNSTVSPSSVRKKRSTNRKRAR